MLRVILIRHGESTFNVAQRVQGRGATTNESVLTDLGKQQAELTGKALASLHFTGALVSPLERAQQTARAILSHQTHPPALQINSNLLEIDLRSWEGKTFSDIKATYPEQYEHWHHSPYQLCIDGFYPVRELFQQAEQFWREFHSQYVDGTILITAHSGINRALICTALGIDLHHYHHLKQSNCGINVLNYRGSSWQLESMNITSHLGSGLPSLKDQHQGFRILLVRHGETEWNRQKRFQGQMDIPLNETGKQQAEKTGQFLQQTKIDLAWSSPLSRAKTTAEIILTHHLQAELHCLDEFREIKHGLWEGKLEREVQADYAQALADWQTRPETVQMPAGENLPEVWERAQAGWKKVLQQTPTGKVALVSAHDAINKAILCNLFGLSPAYFWVFKQGNGGVTVIDYPQGSTGSPYLQALNITSHLSGSVLDVTAAGAL
ncbi:MAG: histidine phosphatase family protein [Pseudanabaenaceae cyanobacterium]